MKRTTVLLFLLGTLSSPILKAQEFTPVRMDSLMSVMDKNNVWMGSIAISKGDQLLYQKTIGYADLAQKKKATIDTRYGIGSISKTFTATLVLKTAELGKLQLNQTLSVYVKGIPNAEKITVRQLLNHSSGVHSITDDKDYLTWNTKPQTEQELVARIIKGGVEFDPGSKHVYSNSNYILLTYILEKVWKKDYASLLKEYICQPLKLEQTTFGRPQNNGSDLSESYRYTQEWTLEPHTDNSVPLGAGAVWSTPADLARFFNALFSHKIINAASLEEMKKIDQGYGIGLFQLPFYEHVGFGHTGGIDGYSSVAGHFDDGNYNVAIISNANNYTNNEILKFSLGELYKKPFPLPDLAEIQLTEEEISSLIGEYKSEQPPIQINITREGNKVFGQVVGQSSFQLKAKDRNTLVQPQFGVKIVFERNENKMTLYQNGHTLVLRK
ncbi:MULTISPECIES: serine hydrolase domain-containing protein [Sphingobacterium]|uniref:Peptidase n=1 Tax=Sphingobacterium multivorum TaxID=28454 RepID=A0A654CBQ3_SPHMU|nr:MULTISPECIES: serine hydrolase domain-containing protein [Sphingobacterium]HBI88375.1 peptidase [Sphingobacterium sp.]QQT44377.1 beta-lactamase family protein [Sphingobacterium multivorum]QQT62868.1 beta-lactamase family protein [Sphingobacterium multivorum]SUJ86872.1 D-alanyl-D-alanine carboxypeptidase precursor [Sphingobacterium multivorum]VXC90771.1 Peptidase [Sphingobacterium multivorum]